MIITNSDNVFHLQTAKTSYIFRVLESGHLENLYYGKKTSKIADAPTNRRAAGVQCGKLVSLFSPFAKLCALCGFPSCQVLK